MKNPFTLRLRDDLLEDLRRCSTHLHVSMTTIIEDALDQTLPVLKDEVTAQIELDRQADAARRQ
jgi:predicted transcriptional regulator